MKIASLQPIVFIMMIVVFGTLLSKQSFAHNHSSTPLALSPFSLALSPTPTQTVPYPTIDSLLSFDTPQSSATDSGSIETDYCVDVPVLMYHHIEPLDIAEERGHAALTVDRDAFASQMQYLVDAGYTTLSANALVDAVRTRQTLPEKSVVITLDDGYDDWYHYAFPIAKAYNITLNLMVSSGLINNVTYMNWEQLREMSESPLIHIYNHTWSHAPLGLSSKEKIISEITAANNQLENNLGVTIDILTYPYGSYSDLAMETAKAEGFAAAFTTEDGRTHCQSTLLKLPRVRVGSAPLAEYGL